MRERYSERDTGGGGGGRDTERERYNESERGERDIRTDRQTDR